MSGKRVLPFLFLVAAVAVLAFPPQGFAGQPAQSGNMIDNVYQQVGDASMNWVNPLSDVGIRLFWYLAVISLVWTFGSHALGGSFNFGALFYEFIRFTCFIGFWRWSLEEGYLLLNSIVHSFYQLGGNFSGGQMNASDMFWKAIDIFNKIVGASGNAGWIDKGIIVLMALAVVCIVAVVVSNLLVLLCAAKILCYGGVFYFGFGGSRWTSDIAVNYYKSVLGIAINIFATLLLIEISSSVFVSLAEQLQPGNEYFGFQNVAAIVIAVVVMGMVIMRVPPMLSGIVSAPTGSIDGIGIGQAMRTVSNMAHSAAHTAAATVRGGSNAAAAIASAHAKMQQNAEMGQGFVAGGRADSTMLRGLETGKILGTAMFNNFQRGGASGGVSRMIEDWIMKDGSAKPAAGNSAAAAPPSSGYVSSVPGDVAQAGRGGRAEGFAGGSIGAAAVSGASSWSSPGSPPASAHDTASMPQGGVAVAPALSSMPYGEGSMAAPPLSSYSQGGQGGASGVSGAAGSQGLEAEIDRELGRVEAAKLKLT